MIPLSKHSIASLWRTGLFVILSLWHLAGHGQNSPHTLTLNVINEDGQMVSDAYVQNAENGSFIGVVNQGLLSIAVRQIPVRILISHVSYESQELSISSTQQDTITVTLTLKNVRLPAVGVSATIKAVNSKASENIKDYLLTDKGILLLLSSGRKNKLKLIDEDGLSEQYLAIPSGANQLYEDCRGLIHLVYKDSTLRVEYFLGELLLTDKTSFSDFVTYIVPCKIAEGDLIVRFIQEKLNQANTYLISHDQPPQFKMLRQMYDIKFEKRIEQEHQRLEGVSSVETNAPKTLGEIRELQRNLDYFNAIIKKDLYTPLFRIDDEFIIFDHFMDSLVTFNLAGRKLSSRHINYHYSEDFKANHVQDLSFQDVYVSMKHRRSHQLYRFNFNTLELEDPIRISKPFPLNIKANKGRVYYLARDLTAPNKNYQLFSEPLK